MIEGALPVFWHRGYAATSIEDLASATGASRHALYQAFNGKRALFLACLTAYSDIVVTPAFARVEHCDADISAIARFLHFQIDRAEESGLSGRGCLMANSMTEAAPHDAGISACVAAHMERLHAGFRGALLNSMKTRSEQRASALAGVLVLAVQGLWSCSRLTPSAQELRQKADALVGMMQRALAMEFPDDNESPPAGDVLVRARGQHDLDERV